MSADVSLQWPWRKEPSLAEIAKETDAYKPESYLPIYERLFEPIRYMPLSLLELGIWNGGSLNAWASYFPYARIAGLDLKLPAPLSNERIRMFEGSQADTAVLARAAAEIAPDGFDIIIDDCSHIGALAKASFWYLFENHLKPGALYCIEDWGTGYLSNGDEWPSWPDGRTFVREADSAHRMPSHDAGMVGFIKQLVDETHAISSREGDAIFESRPSKFSSMTLYFGLCVIRKAAL